MNTFLSLCRETWGPTNHQHLGCTLPGADVVGGVSLGGADAYLGCGEGGLQSEGLTHASFCAFVPLVLRSVHGRAGPPKSSALGLQYVP